MAKADSKKLLSCDTDKTDRNDSCIIVGACKLLLDEKTEDDGISLNSCGITSNYSCSSSSLTSTDDNDITESPTSSSTSVIKSSHVNNFDRTDLWWIHGNGYDLKDFVHNHPGGIEAILLGKGRDCTALVESYHPFSEDRVWKLLEKYYCYTRYHNDDEEEEEQEEKKSTAQKVVTTTTTTIDTMTETCHKQQEQQRLDRGRGRVPDFFYEILKKRVVNVLKSKGIDAIHDRGASQTRIAYYLMIFILWSYSGYLHCSASLWGSFAFAITGWLMGALGHDAGHFAASRWAVVNEYGVWAMSFICNPIMWQQQHTYGHHSFTNEFDRDPDLHHFEVLVRVHRKFGYETKYRFQSNFLYVLFAYLFVVFGTCFWIPWGVLSEGTLYGIVDWNDKDRPTKFYGMLLHLISYLGIVIVLPILMHESMAKAALAIYLHVATLGITFALFSQINHLNETSLESDMDSRQRQLIPGKESKNQDPRLIHSWAASQIETSNNFASRSMFWHVVSNGLNHQIEHHLFPGLNHGHLHHIAPIVKQTCEEYGVEYKSYDTWSDLMNATLEWFDKLSVVDSNGNESDDAVLAVPDNKKSIKIA
eukprot:CAMPEP_0170771026 /NCGR_PEP_ID=MMETSP0733-20121128/7819_1 /TAXON_ID=186038 /ORGANISM="Fragilariopsis kerguelensis, Strain L26-C5" /LENGTH=589 /DNA_ID=CAMNT_0011112717 /DNA_START=54 /DNA_END=1823 /DNA_ORIENTATION=-